MTKPIQASSAVLIGGRGAVGGLLKTRLGPVASLLTIDIAEDSGGIVSDARKLSEPARRAIGAADLVVLATPERIAVDALAGIAPLLRPDALLVDTLSVKGPFALELSRLGIDVDAVGINPMFAPDIGFQGQQVMAVPYRSGPSTAQFIELVRSWGARVTVIDSEHHDRLCASLQATTHATVLCFAMAIQASGLSLSELEAVMPPPFRTLLAMSARILAAPPSVYFEIQATNAWAQPARERLGEALQDLEKLVDAGDAPFARRLDGLRSLLASGTVDYAALCARLYRVG